ncbi:MAG TPA: winged helix-turn-helix domain-containing protein [Caldimonas sp.]|jgi:predicted ATPase
MSSPPPASSGIYRFANWELRQRERALIVDGAPAKLGGRAFDVLLALVERQGRVVPKTELLDAAWPGLVVEENNLSVQISVLRKLLGAGAIANVAGQGYQLAAAPATAAPAPALAGAASPAVPARLFGRDAELAALRSLVGTVPLVSIVGTGGVGKTSVAQAVVANAAGAWRDGVHWIDLSPLRSGARLIAVVAKSLGVFAEESAPDNDDLVRSLAQMQALVALDNCEHLLDEVVTLVGPLLRHGPDLRWIVTSQEPLHLGPEIVYRLGPLEVPLPGAPLDEALRYGALALFGERAKMADRRFELTADRVETAIDLCRQLDGLPLAIEMAAARVATLGLQGVHAQLDQRLRLRAGARDAPLRHHTLLQTYEWSYGLLSPLERCVFRRLEPFAGGFTAPMAQQVCCYLEGEFERPDPWQMLDALSALVDKSLVQLRTATSAGAGDRHDLLESARDFARIQGDAAGETEAVRRRHARAVADGFSTAQHELEHWRDSEWADKYLPERRNVSVALAWACSADEPELLARLVAALAELDTFAQAAAEVTAYPVPMATLERAPVPLRGRAHLELGWAHYLDGNKALGAELTLRALADFEALRDVVGAYGARMNLIRLYEGIPGQETAVRELWNQLEQVDESEIPLRLRLNCRATVALLFDGARDVERLQELRRIAQHAGFDLQAAFCRLNITDALLLLNRFDDAVAACTTMLEAGEPLLRVRAVMNYNRAHALARLGRVGEAAAAARVMLRGLPSYGHLVMDLFAFVAARTGRVEDAGLIAGRSAQVKRDRALHHEESEVGIIGETFERIERALGSERSAALMRQGAGMSTEDALALAFEVAAASPTLRAEDLGVPSDAVATPAPGGEAPSARGARRSTPSGERSP